MKKLLIIWFFLLLGSSSIGQSLLDSTLNCNYNQIPIKTLFQEIETRFNTQIYLSDTSLLSKKVNIHGDNVSLKKVLIIAMPSNYDAVVLDNQIFLAPDLKLTRALPTYPKANKNERGLTSNPNVPQSTQASQFVLEEHIIGERNHINKSRVTVRILIVDGVDSKSIVGASIVSADLKIGGTSGPNGIVELELQAGDYKLKASYMGHESKQILLRVYDNGETKITLNSKAINLSAVEIRGDRQMDVMRKDPGIEKFNSKQVRNLPSMAGEVDFVKVSTTLPGITSIGDGAAGINVRGGGYDQNIFLLNEIPIINTSHLFGFFPAINPNIINNLTVYKGYMPPDFGGALSSVFELEARRGSKKKFGLHGGISPLAANIMVEGPIVKNKLSFVASARSSFSDWVLKTLSDSTLSRSSGVFNDFAAGLDYQSNAHYFSAFGYHSYDKFSMYKTSSYSYSNDGASLKYKRKFSKFLMASVNGFFSSYTFNSSDEKNPLSAYKLQYQLKQWGFKMKLDHDIHQSHFLHYGINFNLTDLDRGKTLAFNEESLFNGVNFGQEKSLESALFIQDHMQWNDYFELDVGFRLSHFAAFGPDDIYVYDPNLPRQTQFILDTIYYDKGAITKQKIYPEYRLSLKIKTDQNGNIKLSANRSHQSLFLLNTSPALAPTSQWKIADPFLEPAVSDLFSLGVFRKANKWGMEYSAELYYKNTQNFTEFMDGADFLKNPNIETAVLQGNLKSYGIELLLKKIEGKFNGWISYTYSRSLAHIDGPNYWEKINNGEAYPSHFDIPHNFNAVLNYQIKKRLILSSVINYQNGRPATFPTGSYELSGDNYIDYSKRNAYRIPDYFRVDLSLTFEGNLKKNKLIHSSFILSIYNLTGRDNPYSVFFDNYKGYLYGYQYSVIGVPIFSATWLFKFGNYETK